MPLLLLVILEGMPKASKPIKEQLDKQTDSREGDRQTGRQIKCELWIKTLFTYQHLIKHNPQFDGALMC